MDHEANILKFLEDFSEDSASNELSDATMVKLLAFSLEWCDGSQLEEALEILDENGVEDEHVFSFLEKFQEEMDKRAKDNYIAENMEW